MAYVKGFVGAVPAANKEAYHKHPADPHMHSANTPNNAPRWVHGGFAAILDA